MIRAAMPFQVNATDVACCEVTMLLTSAGGCAKRASWQFAITDI